MHRVTCWLYADILEFHIKAQRLFSYRGWKQLFKANWKQFRDCRFQGILGNLQRHNNSTELLSRLVDADSRSDISLQLLEKLNTYELERETVLMTLHKDEEDQMYKKYRRVLEWLTIPRPADDKGMQKQTYVQISDHEYFCGVRKNNPGSGDWIMRDQRILSWMEDDTPSNPVVWLHGIPGAGKTILVSRIVEECQKRVEFKTSFFYCNASDPNRTSYLSILTGLLVHMVSQERSLVPFFFSKINSSGQETLKSHQLAEGLFRISCERISKHFVMIDGLDESPSKERKLLLSFLAEVVEHMEEQPGSFRLLIASQCEPDIAEALHKSSQKRPSFSIQNLAIQQKDNKEEIESFVNERVGRIEAKFDLEIQQSECIKKLVSTRANGMFLYATLVLENLDAQDCKINVVAELDDDKFPSKLADAYERILSRLERQWKHTSRVWSQITRLLGWMICAKRPLKRYELQCAFGLDLTDEHENLHCSEAIGSIGQLAKKCGILIRELPGERLELVHNTARFYLVQTRYIMELDVECQLATLCLRYLCMDFFDSKHDDDKVQVSVMTGWLAMQEYAVSKWFQHLSALASVLSKEGFKVQGNLTALEALCDSLSPFVLRYQDDIPDQTLHHGVKRDFAHLADEEVYPDLTLIMSHVSRHMEKGQIPRNEVCFESLNKALQRNRKLVEKLSDSFTRYTDEGKALRQYYGLKRFKCSFINCLNFYEGFNNAKARDQHVDKHRRPWNCEVPDCTFSDFGFTSNKELEKHVRDYHPDQMDLSEVFKLKPKPETPQSRHICPLCAKSFSRKLHKDAHMRSHNGEKPFACTECGRAFTRDNDRKRHEKIHDRR
ncbi:hypothetical protein BT63DRAFT_105847 [Microthyrium microscopicum]|uniref:C2H2-type domain-containing protein n=1 Tax=Microthyrium microscopicum TaxID=703497 RepID=A0A6A6TY01_9PEZI|nr:hypothetical protein BT63DRAFT_105847 [Microthyrium microscopicum]